MPWIRAGSTERHLKPLCNPPAPRRNAALPDRHACGLDDTPPRLFSPWCVVARGSTDGVAGGSAGGSHRARGQLLRVAGRA
jgi:hypothetical protein